MVQKVNPGGKNPGGKGEPHQPDAAQDNRAAWTRPALSRLSARDASNKQTKADDGVQAKGDTS